MGTLEAIKVKLLVLGEPEGSVTSVRMELSSEADLFFHYTHQIDEAGFQLVQEQQKLMVEFPDYTNILIRMLNHCIKEPHSYMSEWQTRSARHVRSGTSLALFISQVSS